MYLKRIKELREDRDIKQEVIAKYLGIAKNTYCNYENNKRNMPIEILIELCKFYNVSADYILELKK